MSRRIVLLAILGAAGAGVVFLLGTGEEERPPTFAIFERAPTQRDRAPEDPHAAGLRTQEQTGELRFAGEFRGHRVYVGRDDTGSCLFDVVLEDATGSTCGPGPIEFKSLTSLNRVNVSFVVVPDGMKWRVYEGRASEARELENVVAVAAGGPVTLRLEGAGRRKDVELPR